jgi:transcriptional regulator with XRE-family HTH domain
MPVIGTELPEWRKRNRFTQDSLRMALGLGSRQTIISWEQSTEPLSRMVQLATLLALEHLPEHRGVDGDRYVTHSPKARLVVTMIDVRS